MLIQKSIQNALAKYADHKDEAVRAELAAFGPALLRAAEIARAGRDNEPAFPKELLEAALQGKRKILEAMPADIAPEALLAALRDISQAFLSGSPDPERRARIEAIDWRAYATAPLARLAGGDPAAYLEQAWTVAVAQTSDDLKLYALTVAALALRALLAPIAESASRGMANLRRDTVHEERVLRCPVCNSEASIAAVVSTRSHGNVKKLYCSVCGASWQFERIRCASCGDEVVSDLSYLHDETDDKHRLHICKNCGAAVPTVFTVDEIGFVPEVESIVCSGLERFYRQSQQAD